LLAEASVHCQLSRTHGIFATKRASIFCSNAEENGFATESLPSRPADQPRERATTILTLGLSPM
jgi:hypothetical protein